MFSLSGVVAIVQVGDTGSMENAQCSMLNNFCFLQDLHSLPPFILKNHE